MNLLAMELQDIPPAPGRGEAPQATQPVQGVPLPQGDAPSGPGGGGGSPFGIGMMLVVFAPMILIIVLMNRSQTKKQREFESKLKKGDRVATSGGMIGRIVEISPQSKYAKLEITSGVKIEILKAAIQGLDAGETAAPDKALEKKSDKSIEKTSEKTSEKASSENQSLFGLNDQSDKDKSNKNKK